MGANFFQIPVPDDLPTEQIRATVDARVAAHLRHKAFVQGLKLQDFVRLILSRECPPQEFLTPHIIGDVIQPATDTPAALAAPDEPAQAEVPATVTETESA